MSRRSVVAGSGEEIQSTAFRQIVETNALENTLKSLANIRTWRCVRIR